MAKIVKTIEPVRQKVLHELRPKKKVCAYCRVSTDSAKQHTSYVAQTEYYQQYIQSREEWEFAGIFADEAKSATKVKNRNEFLRMIKECEKGNIDMVITKSVTRFARNTVDSIETIRKLKALGVAIYFEKENMNTMSEQSEQMLTILSSIAQGESESISTNNRWGIQKRFQDGTYNLGCVAYGYTKDDDGKIIIKEDEAEIVRRIYDEYLCGRGSYTIAKGLNNDNIPTIRTAEKWSDGVVKEILQNPIYEGELLLQKTYTTEGLPFTKKKNKGEVPMYSIKDNHQAIITKHQADRVREIYEYRRIQMGIDDSGKNLNRYEFSSKIICKECGGTFRRQKIYIGKPYEKVQWSCITHIANHSKCSMKAVRDDMIKAAFLTMWNKLVSNYSEILHPLLVTLKALRINEEQETQIIELQNKITELTEQSHILSRVVRKGYIDSAIFIEKQNALNIEIEEYKKRRNALLDSNGFEKEIEGTNRILQILKYNPTIMDEYQEELFISTVDKVFIGKDGGMTFRLINNLELTEYIEKG
ncbi:recombinase family protein [Anaerotignum sp.]|uniref:recombinase family protein n=1 Tax=Anaerotignum sp. TaxID=2039241 RepID=UPI00289C5881|nr:recombinase family protein [Anaerotignum sp.]